MRYFLLITVLCFGVFPAKAGDAPAFAPAAIDAIRREFPGIGLAQIQLLSVPSPNEQFRSVAIRKARFDEVNASWQLQLECVPRVACVPAIAVVHAPDRNLRTASPVSAKPKRLAMLVRRGEHKLISSTFGNIRLHRSVVCLQGGRSGDTIRVRDLTGRNILLASVATDGSLSLWRKP